jgi:TadE-like protein
VAKPTKRKWFVWPSSNGSFDAFLKNSSPSVKNSFVCADAFRMQGTKPPAMTGFLGTGRFIERFRFLNRQRGCSSSSLGKERGATAVEFSIIASLFFAVILGTLDFSMSMFDLNGANFGTRAQARSASNGEWSTVATCNLTLTSGLLGSDERALLCAVKSKTQLSPERLRVQVRFEDPDFPDPNKNVKPQVGKSLVICTMTAMRSISGVYAPLLKGKVLTSIARSRIERDLSTKWTTADSTDERGPLSADTISEEPFAGSNWDFCEAKSVGNAEVGVDVVPASNEFCEVTWTSGQDANPRHYRLDGSITNLSRDPWNEYLVTFTLPAGHTPRSRTFEEGVMSPDHLEDNGLVTWTFEKSSFVPVGGTKVYGIPLGDGDVSPGNGVSLTVTIEPSVATPSIPVMDGLTKVGIPVDDPAVPFIPSDPFANVEYKGCI